MATVTKYSAAITNRDASPKVISNARITKGMVFETIGTAESSAADDVNSKYILCSIPSNARVSRVMLTCDDLGSTGTADIGLYQTTANGGAVADADFFASAQALTTALLQSDVMLESGVIDEAEMEQPVWQLLGLSADPKIDYDVVLTATQAIELAGTITLQVQYCI